MRRFIHFVPAALLAIILVLPVWSQAAFTELELHWNASTSTIAGYNVYRSTVAGGPYNKINGVALVGGLVYDDSTVTPGTKYFYVVTAVDANGVESIFSNETSGTLPLAPAPPTGLTVAPK